MIIAIDQRKRVCTLINICFLYWKLFIPTDLSPCIFHHKLLGFIHFRAVHFRLWIKASFYIRLFWFFDITSSWLSWSIDFGVMIEVVIKQIIIFSLQWVRSSFWWWLIKSWSIVSLSKWIIKGRILRQMLNNVSFFAYLYSNARIVCSWSSWFISSALFLLDVLFTLKIWWTKIVLPPINLFVLLPVSPIL